MTQLSQQEGKTSWMAPNMGQPIRATTFMQGQQTGCGKSCCKDNTTKGKSIAAGYYQKGATKSVTNPMWKKNSMVEDAQNYEKFPTTIGVVATTSTLIKEVQAIKPGVTLVEEYLKVYHPQAYQDKYLVSQEDPQLREIILDQEEEVEADHLMVVDTTQAVQQDR